MRAAQTLWGWCCLVDCFLLALHGVGGFLSLFFFFFAHSAHSMSRRFWYTTGCSLLGSLLHWAEFLSFCIFTHVLGQTARRQHCI